MRNLKVLLLTMTLGLLTACSPSYSESTGKFKLPPELSDCRIFIISSANLTSSINVVRCPNSITSTSYKSGKSTQYTIVQEE